MLPTGDAAVTFARLIAEVVEGPATCRSTFDVLSDSHLLLVGDVEAHGGHRLLNLLGLSQDFEFHICHWRNGPLRVIVVVDG